MSRYLLLISFILLICFIVSGCKDKSSQLISIRDICRSDNNCTKEYAESDALDLLTYVKNLSKEDSFFQDKNSIESYYAYLNQVKKEVEAKKDSRVTREAYQVSSIFSDYINKKRDNLNKFLNNQESSIKKIKEDNSNIDNEFIKDFQKIFKSDLGF